MTEEEDDIDKFLADEEAQAMLDREAKEREEQMKKRPKIDPLLEKTWVYPVDPDRDLRDYQYEIAHKALFKNTLVCLPTGLGKTLIASVVMYNIYRWFPTGKIVFVAPTVSLVVQQHKACCEAIAFGKRDVIALTGTVRPDKRKQLWSDHRIFFCTPQCVVKDLNQQRVDAHQIVLLVVDEAHRATANHDYCRIVQLLSAKTTYFRVLGLTATPGKDLPTIQKVLTNLNISQVEVRSEADLKQFTHDKSIVVLECPITEPIKELQLMFFQLVSSLIKILNQNRAYFETRPEEVSYQALHQAMISFMGSDRGRNYMVSSAFGIAISLYHAYSDLLTQGIHVFIKTLEKMEIDNQDPKRKNKLRNSIFGQPLFHDMKRKAKDFLEKHRHEHPKIVQLLKIVREHFKKHEKTRIIVFVGKKQTVRYITEVLSREPGNRIRAMEFVGQSKTGDISGLTAKEQKEIITNFTKGSYNVLVSTSVGEEGLDIGEVDMIICYDAVSSPTRMIQRMGRTGRKRDGTAVMILTEGYEANTYRRALERTNRLFEQMKKLPISKGVHFFQNCPRLVSYDIEPECVMQNLTNQDSSKSFTTTPAKLSNRKQSMITTVELKYLHNNYGKKYFPVAGRFSNYLASSFHKHTKVLTPFCDIPHSDAMKAIVSSSQKRLDPTYDWSTHTLTTPFSRFSTISFDVAEITKNAEEELREQSLLVAPDGDLVEYNQVSLIDDIEIERNIEYLKEDNSGQQYDDNSFGAEEFYDPHWEDDRDSAPINVHTEQQQPSSPELIASPVRDQAPDIRASDDNTLLSSPVSPIPKSSSLDCEIYSPFWRKEQEPIVPTVGLKHKDLNDLMRDVFVGVMHPVFMFRQDIPDCLKQKRKTIRAIAKPPTQHFPPSICTPLLGSGPPIYLSSPEESVERSSIPLTSTTSSEFLSSTSSAPPTKPAARNNQEKKRKRNAFVDTQAEEVSNDISSILIDDSGDEVVPTNNNNTNDEEYVIHKLLDKKREDGKAMYLVQWEGYGEEDNTWEPEANLPSKLVKQFNLKPGKQLYDNVFVTPEPRKSKKRRIIDSDDDDSAEERDVPGTATQHFYTNSDVSPSTKQQDINMYRRMMNRQNNDVSF